MRTPGRKRSGTSITGDSGARAGAPKTRLCLLSIVFCCAALLPERLLPAQDQSGASDGRWAILATGISGDPDLQKQYLKQLVDLRTLLEGPMAFPQDHVIALLDDPKLDPARIQYQSTRENLEKACKIIGSRAGRDDLVFIFLEGHGSADGNVYKLNLVGPDPTANELAGMFYAIPARRFVVVNATNSSGASLERLSGMGKIVISATKSGTEKNLTHLGQFFIDSLANNNADVDKNNRVSMFEAFTYAARRVEEHYTKDGSLQTEHPMLSDNGEAQSISLADAGSAPPNLMARAVYLDPGLSILVQGNQNPETAALARESQSLERQIELLKSAKDEMSEAEYEKRLEGLLLKLAEVQAKLRKK